MTITIKENLMADSETTCRPTRVPGHKCTGVRVAYEATCECGWRGDFNYGGKFGNGGRAAAYQEWRTHVEKCSVAGKEGGNTK